MPQSINLGATAIAVGQRQFLIDGLPNNSHGFELLIGVNASWTGAVGRLFDLVMELSLNAATFQRWIAVSVDGGVVRDRSGNVLSTWRLAGTWPGTVDGSGDRTVLRGTDLRITTDTKQAFNVDSLIFRPV